MPIELTCELLADRAEPFDHASLARRLSTLEAAGFGRAILTGPSLPTPGLVRSALRGSAMQLALTHQVGAIEPPAFAQHLSALDRESGARISLRVCGEAGADGHFAHWRRLDEFLVLLKRLWLNDEPFEYEGAFYRLRDAEIADKGVRGAEIPIRIADALSGTALKVAGRHADVFELSPGSPTEIRVLINRVRAAASEWGRGGKIRFALPVGIGAAASPVRTAVQLLRYAELGVEEFVVRGSDDPRQLEQFGRETAHLLRNSLEGREPPPRRITALAPGVRLYSSRVV